MAKTAKIMSWISTIPLLIETKMKTVKLNKNSSNFKIYVFLKLIFKFYIYISV